MTNFNKLFCVLVCVMLVSAIVDGQSKVWRKRSDAVGSNVGINPYNPNTIYCEKVASRVFISRDKGKNWTQLGAALPISGIRHILVHPNDTLTIFVVAFSGGLYKTTNEGANWYQVLANYGIDGESMDYDPAHPDTMFAGNYNDGAVFRSFNRGETWTFRGISGSHLCGLVVRPDSTNILYAGTGASTISKSTDGGVTWRMVNNGGTDEAPKFSINPSNPMITYATNYGGNDALDNFIKTTDGGEHWFKTSLQNISVWSVALDVQHPETVYVGRFSFATNGIDRTTNGGVTFQNFSAGLPVPFFSWNLRVHPLASNDVWTAGTIGGFFNSGAIFQLVDSSTTFFQGTVRDALTGLPVVAKLRLLETGDSVINSSTFSFNYYNNDPTLTPTMRITAANYTTKDTVIAFVQNTIVSHDVYLQLLPHNSISGIVFNDINGNGTKDNGETMLSNWLVRISGPISDSILTDVNGVYSFDSLTTGTYTLSEKIEDGWMQTFPGCPFTSIISFTEGTDVSDVNFGNEQLAPGAILLSEDFTSTTFPPHCWSLVDVNSGPTWFRATTNNHSEPASARNGTSIISDGKANDWLFSNPVELKTNVIYRLGWWHRTFINGGATGLDSLDVTVGTIAFPGAGANKIYSRGFDSNLSFEYAEREFTVSSSATYYIGFHDYSAAGNTIRIDDVTLVYARDTVTSSINVNARWNLVSLPLSVGNDSVKKVFPSASSPFAFGFTPSGYSQNYTMLNGSGYWLRFPSAGIAVIGGNRVDAETVQVMKNWNLVGAITNTVLSSAFTGIGTSIASNFYGYNNGYFISDSIVPGKGYWVKVNADGQLALSPGSFAKSSEPQISANLKQFNTLTFADAQGSSQTLFFCTQTDNKLTLSRFELPPPPPAGAFDVRFTSQHVLEVIKEGTMEEFPIELSSVKYPVTLTWDNKSASLITATLHIDNVDIQLRGSGRTQIASPASHISLKLSNAGERPTEFALEQNYPNPFNPATSIRYQLPVDGIVLIKIYNVLGQEIKLLANEFQEAGYKSVSFDASELPSGVYFYKLSVGSFSDVKKMILTK